MLSFLENKFYLPSDNRNMWSTNCSAARSVRRKREFHIDHVDLEKQATNDENMSQMIDKDNNKVNKFLQVNKGTLKIVLRTFGFFVSIVGFLFQTTQLFSLYLSGKTLVDNRVEHLKHSELPAITICLPTFVSMDKFAEFLLKNSKNQTILGLYERYKEFNERSKMTWNKEIEEEQMKLYKNFSLDIFLEQNVSLIEIFNTISMEPLNIIRFNTLALDENDVLANLTMPKSFESLVPFSDPRKCFTFFSGLDPAYRGRKFKLIKLEMQFEHNRHIFPTVLYNSSDFHITLHSPNALPDYRREESFLNLKIGGFYSVSYSGNHIHLLPAPYETSCRNYPLNGPEDDMKSDCIQKCIDEKMLDFFPDKQCVFTYYNFKLIRKENLKRLANIPLCDYWKFDQDTLAKMNNAQIHLDTDCKNKCLDNCEETFYEFKVGEIKGWTIIKNANEFALTVQHNRFPDQIITHKPIMRWIEVASNFGGLLGMWLGLSIAFVLDYLINLI